MENVFKINKFKIKEALKAKLLKDSPEDLDKINSKIIERGESYLSGFIEAFKFVGEPPYNNDELREFFLSGVSEHLFNLIMAQKG